MSNSLFGVDATKLSDPQGQGANVVAPATANPGSAIVESIGAAANLFSAYQKDKSKQKDDQILNEYTTKLNGLADAVSSGSMNPREANARAAQYFQSYSGTIAPHLTEELVKRRRAIFEGSSLSEAEKAAEMQRTLELEALKSYQANGGYISPNATPEERQLFIKTEAARKTEQERWQRFRQEQEERRTSTRFNMEVEKATEEKMVVETITNLASNAFPAFLSSMDGLLKDTEAAGANADWQTANVKRNAVYTALQLQLKQVAAANPSLADNWGKLLDQANSTYEKMMNPTTRAEVSKSAFEELKYKAYLMTWNKSPKAQQSLLLNYFAPNTYEAMAGIRGTSAEISAMFAGTPSDSGEAVPPVIGDPVNSKPVISSIMSNMKNTMALPDGSPEKISALTGVKNQVNNLLIDVYQAGTNEFKQITPQQLNDVAALISSPEFAELNQRGLINPQARAAASRVFAISYNQPLINDAAGIIEKMQKELKGVTVKFEDGQIVISGQDTSPRGRGLGTSPIHQSMLYKGKEVAKALDRVVKMSANLEGEKDYAKYWEEKKRLFLPTIFKAPEGTKEVKAGGSTPKSGGTVTDTLQREYDRLVSAGKPSWLSQEAYDEQVKIVKRELESSKGK